MVRKLLNSIISYIEFLKAEYELSISIHSNADYLSEYMYKLAPYNIHCNPYCLFLKLNRTLWDKCIEQQNSLFTKCGDSMISCTCYAGVSEFVMPILCNSKVVGCICVSGYRDEDKKLAEKHERIANEYCIDLQEITQMYDNHLTNPPSSQFIKTVITPLRSMLEQLCLQDNVLIKKFKSSTSDYIYGHILEYIQLNYASKIKLEDISNACHCSTSYISHTFKKRTGMNINSYINQIRLKEAARLLKQTNLSISEIAFMIGFTCSNYFTNIFTKYYQISPKKYRKLNA